MKEFLDPHTIREKRETPHQVSDAELRSLMIRIISYGEMSIEYDRFIQKSGSRKNLTIVIRIKGYKTFKTLSPLVDTLDNIEEEFQCLENEIYHMIMDSFIRLIKKCNEVDSAKEFLNLP